MGPRLSVVMQISTACGETGVVAPIVGGLLPWVLRLHYSDAQCCTVLQLLWAIRGLYLFVIMCLIVLVLYSFQINWSEAKNRGRLLCIYN